MTDFVSVASRSSSLFNQSLVASLLQPLSQNQSDYKSYRTTVNLKINEQRNEVSGEKELRFEISRTDDYEFLFAEVLNNDKYQKLAREHDLIVDFDAFPRTIIQKLLSKTIANSYDDEKDDDGRKGALHSFVDGRPTEITLKLDSEKTYCSFELFSKTPISKGRIFALKLSAVRGDQLTAHLLKICSSQATKLTGFRKITAELEKLREENTTISRENKDLKQNVEQLRTEADQIAELEDELALLKEEKQNLLEHTDKKDEDVEKLQEQVDDLAEELEIVGSMLTEEQARNDQVQKEKDILRRENGELRQENSQLLKDVQKSKHIFKKYMNEKTNETGQQSVDLRKLKELEIDLKEKDCLITTLTETISGLQRELKDEKLKKEELQQNFDQSQRSNLELNERLQVYRNNRAAINYGTPNLVGNLVPSNYISPTISAPFGGGVKGNTPAYRQVFPRASSLNGIGTPFGRTSGLLNQQTSPYSDPPGAIYQPTTPTPFYNTTNLQNDTTTSTLNATTPNMKPLPTTPGSGQARFPST